MSDRDDTELLAKSYGLKFEDKGNGHVQIKGHGVLVNYYPDSKKKTVFCKDGRRATNCTPWDAVRMCLTKGQGVNAEQQMKPKKVSTNRPQFDIKPVQTNPAGLAHFYAGNVPPWDESLGEFAYVTFSDSVRAAAYRLEMDALEMRIEADECDEVAA
tara:strand:- start:3164 stop:3634 length:471 start_codon:yes stop_codon:yes gene_type:complete